MIVLDDGVYYIELVSGNEGAAKAPGLLKRRIQVNPTSFFPYESLGFFCRSEDGMWGASIDAPTDARTGVKSRDLGLFDERLSAMVALWSCRHEAYSRKEID